MVNEGFTSGLRRAILDLDEFEREFATPRDADTDPAPQLFE